jgi:IclR family pca regulon transcriptional regulator
MTLAEVARASDVTRATARRILLTLMHSGYVASANGRSFSLTPRILEFGRGYLSSGLVEVAERHMRDLVARTRESSSMAVLDGLDIVYIARVPTQRIMTISLSVGSRLPAYATSMGRVLLSHLDPAALRTFLATTTLQPLTRRTITSTTELEAQVAETRRRGWAEVDQELEDGVRSIAVAVFGSDGRAAAALNVSGHASRVTMNQLRREFLPLLKETAARIHDELRA